MAIEVQSHNKRPPTRLERDHIARIATMPCAVCDATGPSEVHEIKQGAWFLSVPLCSDCHRGARNGLHGERRMWALKKLDELDALGITIKRLHETL